MVVTGATVRGDGRRSLRGPRVGRGARGAALALLLASVGACGTPCRQVRARRDAFLQGGRPSPGPHLRLLVPVGSLNRLLIDQVRRLEPVAVRLPAPRGSSLSGWTLALTRLNLGPAAGGRVAVMATLALRQAGRLVTEADVNALVEPRVREGLPGRPSRLVIPLRGRDLQEARLRVGSDLRRRLDELLRAQLPPRVRASVPRALTARAVGELATWISEHLFDLARDHLLADAGVLTTLSLSLPDLPLRDLQIHWRRATLVLDLTTGLPVSRPLVAPPDLDPPGRGLRIVLGAPAAAALYNWLAARGAAPARADRDGQPDPDGPYELYAVASPGARPWGLRAWDLARCAEVDLVGTPQVRVEGGRVQVSVDDGRVERVLGPPALEAGAWLRGLGADALRVSASFASTASLAVGDARLAVRLRRAQVRGDVLVLDADWAPAPTTSVAPDRRPRAAGPRADARHRPPTPDPRRRL